MTKTPSGAAARYKLDTRKLTELPQGRHALGIHSIYLDVSRTLHRSWLQRLFMGGKERWMALGPLSEVGVKAAIAAAEKNRALVREGIDPVAQRQEAKRAETRAGKTVADVLAALREAKEPGQRPATVRSTRLMHAAIERGLGDKPMQAIDTETLVGFLREHWAKTPWSATKMIRVLAHAWDYAATMRWVDERLRNPAEWKGGLEHVLSKPVALRQPVHVRAVGYEDVPALYADLAARDSIGARALRLLVLTGCRTGEVIGAAWAEIDMDAGVWTIPGSRMKAGRPHQVALVPAAVALLRELHERRRGDGAWVFPSHDARKHLSNMALLNTLDRAGWLQRTTVHGLRSALRSFLADAGVTAEVAEACLAHQPDSVTRAYQRSGLIDAKLAALLLWERHVLAVPKVRAVA